MARSDKPDALRGSIDLLILKALSLGPTHGWGIGLRIQELTQEMGMNLSGVRRVLEMERRLARLEAENAELREELVRQHEEHQRIVAEVHRSYKREIVLAPRGELVQRTRGMRGIRDTRKGL